MNYDCYRGMLTSKRYIEEDDRIRGLSIAVSHPACWYEYGMSVKKDIKAKLGLVIALRLRNTSYNLAVQSTSFAITPQKHQLQSGFLLAFKKCTARGSPHTLEAVPL